MRKQTLVVSGMVLESPQANLGHDVRVRIRARVRARAKVRARARAKVRAGLRLGFGLGRAHQSASRSMYQATVCLRPSWGGEEVEG